MNERVIPCGPVFQVTLPNGGVVKSEDRKALENLLAVAVRQSKREERILLAWNQAADIAEARYLTKICGRGPIKDGKQRVQLNVKQIDLAVERVSKSESAFLAALVAFEDPSTGHRLLERVGCVDLRQLAEALSPTHSHAIAQIFIAFRDG